MINLLHRRKTESVLAPEPSELGYDNGPTALNANRIALIAYLHYIEADESRNAARRLARLENMVVSQPRGRHTSRSVQRPQLISYTRERHRSPATAPTKPLAHGVLSQLPRARVFPEDRLCFGHDDTECSICCNRLVEGVMLTRLPCGHIYHVQCLTPWVTRHSTCPDCRYELPSDANSPSDELLRRERMKDRATYRCPCGPSGIHTCFFVDPSRNLMEQCKTFPCSN